MPIDVETFESSPEDRLQNGGETNAERVMRFLAAHPDRHSCRVKSVMQPT